MLLAQKIRFSANIRKWLLEIDPQLDSVVPPFTATTQAKNFITL
jgi:hypothetical protein